MYWSRNQLPIYIRSIAIVCIRERRISDNLIAVKCFSATPSLLALSWSSFYKINYSSFSKYEKRVTIKFLWLLAKSSIEIQKIMQQVLRFFSLSHETIRRCVTSRKKGRRGRWNKTWKIVHFKTQKMIKVVSWCREDRLTILLITTNVGISNGTVLFLTEDLKQNSVQGEFPISWLRTKRCAVFL